MDIPILSKVAETLVSGATSLVGLGTDVVVKVAETVASVVTTVF